MALKQANRPVRISTPLGEDAVQLVGFRGHEEMSRLFEFHLDLISEDNSIDPKDIVGHNITFSIDYTDDGSERWFNGHVQRFVAAAENVKGIRAYRAVVVPWLWFLTQTTDCRIFQEMTIVEIIEKIFEDLGFSDFDTSGIQGTHPKREYCVQYRESDFEFVSRLAEEEGVFYFFEHEDGKHKLVMADSVSAYYDCKESNVDYPTDTMQSRVVTPHIDSWEHQYEYRSGAVARTDYNFKKPKSLLMTSEKTLMNYKEVKSFEQYDYPGGYTERDIGQPIARIRMEEIELEHDMVHGSSTCKSFAPGARFKVGSHPSSTEKGKKFVVRSVTHSVSGMSYGSLSAGQGDVELEYANQFTCFPDASTFRPARTTRKPFVQGCQTAVVTGPAGEEMYVDEFGRIKVQFHWDREGGKNDGSSCWIRVSQNWAGQGWGGMFVPHVGQEVIVSFLEGDPDQPIVTGRVYNAAQTVPLGLPDNKHRSIIRDHVGNEITMWGEEGAEQIKLHSPYANTTVAIGAPHSPGDGFQVVTDAFIDMYCDLDCKVDVKGCNFTTIVGLKATQIGGLKYESIIGGQVKINAAVNVDIAKSKTFKFHDGTSYIWCKDKEVDLKNSVAAAYLVWQLKVNDGKTWGDTMDSQFDEYSVVAEDTRIDAFSLLKQTAKKITLDGKLKHAGDGSVGGGNLKWKTGAPAKKPKKPKKPKGPKKTSRKQLQKQSRRKNRKKK